MNKKGGAFIGLVAWIALIVAVGALVLGWITYRKIPGQNLAQDLNRSYNEYYQKSRLEIGKVEINSNLDSARRDIEGGNFNSALTQIEEVEADLRQLAEDLEANLPPSNIFAQLKDQIRSQNREAALETIRELQETIERVADSANRN